jgi:lipoyl(octanoyl) transferase
LLFCRLGTVDYDQAHEVQRTLQAKRIEGAVEDVVLLLEHPPVLTLGRSAKNEHILASKEMLAARGISVHEVGRGGDVTYHGPGQLVAYPIIDLRPDRKDVRKYVWTLEEAMIRTCGDFGIDATRIRGLNGTWVGERKVGAVGVRISRWVTMHGLALNANSNLNDFQLIVPCGIEDKAVTSLSNELDRAVTVDDVTTPLATHFASLYDDKPVWTDTLPGGLSLSRNT